MKVESNWYQFSTVLDEGNKAVEPEKRYRCVLVAGTFDRFHEGHRAIINAGLDRSVHLGIGLMSDNYIQNSHKRGAGVAPFEERKRLLEFFLNLSGKQYCVDIFPVDDPRAHPSLTDIKYEAIVVSPETEKGVEFINSRRGMVGVKKLEVIRVGHVRDKNGNIISSTRIRSGEIFDSFYLSEGV